jgi:hypothetical protein
MLAAALARKPAPWTLGTGAATEAAVLRAIEYHGVSGLLHERLPAHADWPEPVRAAIRERAMAQAMWELRHKIILSALLETLAEREIASLLLKGSAIAYDLYDRPGDRVRGDTDLLVRAIDIPRVRDALRSGGFRNDGPSELPEELGGQESWTHVATDGSRHVIDLHWHTLNAPALQSTFTFDHLWSERRALTTLSNAAYAPRRSMMLAHACVHRALHDCAPYFVGDDTYFGGDRLIWVWDIALLAQSLSRADWEELVSFAEPRELGRAIVEGLAAAQALCGAVCPTDIEERLRKSGSSRYLRSGQFGRAAMDWWAMAGPRHKMRYAIARLIPSASFMRAKYPGHRDLPLPLLHLRRLGELMRRRPTGAQS